jgi:hypothetical protein
MIAAAVQDLAVETRHTPAEISWDASPRNRLVAMHWRRTPEFHEFLTSHNFDVIVTARHPMDVLISILQFSQHEPATARWVNGEGGDESRIRGADPGSAAFLEYALSSRAAALLAVSAEWSPYARAVVRYEDLVHRPEQTLAQVLGSLGLEAKGPLSNAVKDNAIERLRDFSVHHFWRGEPGIWRRLITPENARQIHERHKTVFEVMGYGLGSSYSLSQKESLENWKAIQ